MHCLIISHRYIICMSSLCRPLICLDHFYPCYAILARVLAMALCPSVCVCVCLAQVGVLSKRMNESSWFWHGSFLPPVLHCVKRNLGISKNKGTSIWNFVPNSGLRKFLLWHIDR